MSHIATTRLNFGLFEIQSALEAEGEAAHVSATGSGWVCGIRVLCGGFLLVVAGDHSVGPMKAW
jgi:hypothetical protein